MVAVVVSKDDVVGVTVTVLVLMDGGGTTAVVVTVVTLLVVVVDDVVTEECEVAEFDGAAITPQATRLLSLVDPAVQILRGLVDHERGTRAASQVPGGEQVGGGDEFRRAVRTYL